MVQIAIKIATIPVRRWMDRWIACDVRINDYDSWVDYCSFLSVYLFNIFTATRQQCFDGTVTFCLEPAQTLLSEVWAGLRQNVTLLSFISFDIYFSL